MSSTSFAIRAVLLSDIPLWCSLRHLLWPHASLDEHAHEAKRLLPRLDRYVAFLAVSSCGEALGFAEAAIRHDYVNGCDTSPVVFLEGIYVVPRMRHQGIAAALCAAIQQWGASHACEEFASDTAVDNVDAQALHRALGFQETERVVFFRKRASTRV
ncbi:aminoglycoside 6'-N-acetyltransferase [Trinickia caryophylli]|nr:N-acetyltransferase [Trinickia caryophylli]TRX20323.1 GNAT family N-acetyltransferase [Trinickia caryophylli]